MTMATSIPDVSEMVRVDSDEIYVDYVGRDQYWMWQEKRFTGISVEYRIDGHIVSETTYIDGIETGPNRNWYPDGKLESEGESIWNRPHGFYKTWYESGQLKNEGCFDLGYKIWSKEWDEEGNLIREYKIEDHPSELKSLEAYKSWREDQGLI
jgi:antitoxin component YwqK of YwqJK toxin-antitoxin module